MKNWIRKQWAALVVVVLLIVVAAVFLTFCLGWSSFYHWWTAPRVTATVGVATVGIAAFATFWFNHRANGEARKRALIAINRDLTTGDVAKARQVFSRAEWRWRGEHGDRTIYDPPSAQDRDHERKYPKLSTYDSEVFDSYWVLLGALERTAAELAVASSSAAINDLVLKRSFIHFLRWLHLYLYVTSGPSFEKPTDSAVTRCEKALVKACALTGPDLTELRRQVGEWTITSSCECLLCKPPR